MWKLSQSENFVQCSWKFWLTWLILTEFLSGRCLNLSVIPFPTFFMSFFQAFKVECQNSFRSSVNTRAYFPLGKSSRFSWGKFSVSSFNQKELDVKVLFIQLNLSPAQCSLTRGTPSPPRYLGRKTCSLVVLYDPACMNLHMMLSICSATLLGGSGIMAAMWLNLLRPWILTTWAFSSFERRALIQMRISSSSFPFV